MRNLDRFFDAYARVMPRGFIEAALAVILMAPVLLILG